MQLLRLIVAPAGGGSLRHRFNIGFASVVMLVALRIVIGWHFFYEGAQHHADPHWSSEGFLRAAKGPLAPRYQAVIPDYYGWQRRLYADAVDAKRAAAKSQDEQAAKAAEADEAADDAKIAAEVAKPAKPADAKSADAKPTGRKAIDRWAEEVIKGWKGYEKRFARYYSFDDEQKVAAEAVLQRRLDQLDAWIEENQPTIETHIHEWRRLEKWRADPAADAVPFQRKRVAEKQGSLDREASAWLQQVKNIEQDFHEDLASLQTEKQHNRGPLPQEKSPLEKIDLAMSYGILAIGACLVAGLLTRLASLAGGLFLLSVMLSQPFWLPDTAPTFNQSVEMVALFALATTPVGRWGGLDFFIHYLFVRPFAAKG